MRRCVRLVFVYFKRFVESHLVKRPTDKNKYKYVKVNGQHVKQSTAENGSGQRRRRFHITCDVCFCEYDHDDRKPKFLQCSHTVCLSCLKVNCSLVLLSKLNYTVTFCIFQGIRNHDSIVCPFCRDTFVKFDVESLPNNAYAFYILKLKEKNVLPKLSEIVTTPL